MVKSRFVSAGVTRLPLSDGDWVEVKNEISWQEQRRITASAWSPRMDVNTQTWDAEMNWTEVEFERMATYIVDWSFRDADDKPVAVSRSALNNLRQDTVDEIKAALDAHVARQSVPKAETSGETSPAAT